MAGARQADKPNGQRHQRLAEAEATPAQRGGVSRSRNQAATEGPLFRTTIVAAERTLPQPRPCTGGRGRGRRGGEPQPRPSGGAGRRATPKERPIFKGDQLRARTTEAERLGWVGPYCMVQLFVKHIASFANSFAKLFAKLLFDE